VDKETSVSLRLMDSLEAAKRSTTAGVRRLFSLQLQSEMTHISRHLQGVERMALHYAPLGRGDDLKRQLLAAIVNKALFDGFAEIRTQAAFIERAEAGWRRLSEASKEITALAAETLALFHDLSLQLGRPTPPMLADSIRDLREQLAALVTPDFLTRTPAVWLPHLPRFLRGMQIRLKKLLNAGLSRDAEAMRLTTPHWIRYGERSRTHRKKGLIDPALEVYRWMLEEYRVSLFAQELKTSIPISAKRLDAQWTLAAP
jgi:ATP-dependent helicase HrpA